MKEDLLQRAIKMARQVAKEETRQGNLVMFQQLGLDQEDIERMAKEVGLALDDLLLLHPSHHVISQPPSSVPGRSEQLLHNMHELVREIHHTTVQEPKQRLATLTQMERDLYDAAQEDTPMGAKEICHATKLHFLNSNTKQALSNLVKNGLLMKRGGKNGYLRVPL